MQSNKITNGGNPLGQGSQQPLSSELSKIKNILSKIGVSSNPSEGLLKILSSRIQSTSISKKDKNEIIGILKSNGITDRKKLDKAEKLIRELIVLQKEFKKEVFPIEKVQESKTSPTKSTGKTPAPPTPPTNLTKSSSINIVHLKTVTDTEKNCRETFNSFVNRNDGRDISEANETAKWAFKVFFHSIKDFINRLINNQPVKGSEIQDWAKRIIPGIDINDLIAPDLDITIEHLQSIYNLVTDEILLPKNLFMATANNGFAIGYVPEKPEILISPMKVAISLYNVYPLVGEFTTAYSKRNRIFYPIHRDLEFFGILPRIEKTWAVYKRNNMDRNPTTYLNNPSILLDWMFMMLYEHSEDVVQDYKKDTLAEELAHCDGLYFAERKLGKRIHEMLRSDRFEAIMANLKDTSPLVQELNNARNNSDEEETLLGTIEEVRAKLIGLAHSPFPPFFFIDCVGFEVLKSHIKEGTEEKHYPIARQKIATLLGPHLLGTEEGILDRPAWHKFFIDNLIGKDQEEDRELIRGFNEKILSARKIVLDEHFHWQL